MLRRPTPLLALLALLAFALALATACGGGNASTTPTATVAATKTAIATATATVPAATTTYPLTVTDQIGRTVIVKAEPQRIVAASPSALELLYAAGGKAIARTTTAKVPAEVAALKDIGSAEKPSFENIVAQSPDLVLADASLQAQLAKTFEGSLSGVPVIFVGAQKYDDVAAGLLLLGKVVNRQDQAAAAAKVMNDAKAQAKAAATGKTAPRTLIMIGAPNDPFVALPESFIGDIAALGGGNNIAAGQPQGGPLPGYTKLSAEKIVAANPQVIIAVTLGPPNGPTLASGLKGNAAYANIDAVKNGRVHEVDLDVYLLSPGPRAAKGLADLQALLFPAGR